MQGKKFGTQTWFLRSLRTLAKGTVKIPIEGLAVATHESEIYYVSFTDHDIKENKRPPQQHTRKCLGWERQPAEGLQRKYVGGKCGRSPYPQK